MKLTQPGSAFAGALLLLAVVPGCAGNSSDPNGLADKITRAVYANDYDATTADFDDDTKKAVTRAEVGALSDKLHALGDIQQITPRTSDADKGRYDFTVALDHGSALVQLRLDPDGKIGAYRVVLPAPPG
ncbi:MAG TPA: hypothetical protein VGD50_05895 [Candidatus Baltobacteraceae bacterium]